MNNYSNLDLEQKFAKVLVDLRRSRPFYSAVYETIERIENNNVSTIGVTTKQIIYNKDFLDKLPYNEFLFINLHEITHIALMHVSRINNRDATLWNIACDLYVNKLLSVEFNIQPGEERDGIKMPTSACWCNSINIDTECAESIYDVLNKEANSNGYNDAKLNRENGTFDFSYTGTKGDHTFNISINTEVIYNDILESNKSDMAKEYENKQVLAEAKTRFDMQNKNAGYTQGYLFIKVNNILKSHIDWRVWLKKYCIKAKSTDSTFSNPDKRMFYQDAIYPGQEMDESNSIKNIKICIDTSGSISEEDLQYIFGQIKSLSKTFKIEAEIIAWDTKMQSCGNIFNNTNLFELNLSGGGGTDPSCLFEYFDSKKCRVKPLVTLVFTDGYWDIKDNPKWTKKYKDTLWVLTKDAYDKFKPPFGLKANVRYD